MEDKVARKRKKQRTRIRPGCLISVLLIAAAAAVLLLTPPFNINKIEVTGNEKVSTEVILNASGITTSMNIFRADVKTAAKNIRAQQFVEDVKVSRILPSTIKIKVTEGNVAAYINYEDNLVGISLEGKTLCFIDAASREAGKPVIYSLSVEKSAIGEYVEVSEKRKLESALRLLRSFDEMGILEKITAISMNTMDNIAFRYTDNLKIEFGSTDDYDYKLEWLAEIIESLGDNPQGLVNMQNPENITYRQSIE